MSFDISGYIQVSERLQQFKLDYPEGSVQTIDWQIVDIAGEPHIVVQAAAYRTPDDPRPGIGTSFMSMPGKSPYTRGSELECCETSAWGRSLAALGIATHRGVASADEIRIARETEASQQAASQIKNQILKSAQHWANDQDLSFESANELCKAFLDAQGEATPSKGATVEELEQLLNRLEEREALTV